MAAGSQAPIVNQEYSPVFIDAENLFTSGGSAGQPLAGFGIATTALANVIDSGPLGGQNTPNTNVGRDWGMGYPMWLVLLLVGTPVGAGATIDAQLVSSASPALTAPNVMLDLTGGALAITSPKWATGSRYAIALPRAGIGGTTGWLRYIGLNFIVATAVLTGGTIIAFLARDLQDNLVYASGFTVS